MEGSALALKEIKLYGMRVTRARPATVEPERFTGPCCLRRPSTIAGARARLHRLCWQLPDKGIGTQRIDAPDAQEEKLLGGAPAHVVSKTDTFERRKHCKCRNSNLRPLQFLRVNRSLEGAWRDAYFWSDRVLLDQIAGRWQLLILGALWDHGHKARFNALERAVPGISQNTAARCPALRPLF
jgi:HxlR-like helix-turn-helix protein